jgi:hypothetical protein
VKHKPHGFRGDEGGLPEQGVAASASAASLVTTCMGSIVSKGAGYISERRAVQRKAQESLLGGEAKEASEKVVGSRKVGTPAM